MGDHALTFPQPVKDFDLEIGAMARFNLSPLRNAVLDDERVPALTGTEQRVQWRLQRFVRFPDDYPRLHAIAVSQRRVRLNEIRDHVDALLLDAERGDFREGRRFDKADASLQRLLAAPAIDQHGTSRLHLHGVSRQDFDHDFERGIAQLYERRAGHHHALALFGHAQHPPVTGARTKTVSEEPLCPARSTAISMAFATSISEAAARARYFAASICCWQVSAALRARSKSWREMSPVSISFSARARSRPACSHSARACSTTASASCFNCSAAATRAFASANWRGSSGAIGDGSMRAITSSRLTVSPRRRLIRSSLPDTGAATTKRSRERVFPSASTVTRIGPHRTRATSTLTGEGRNAMAPATPATPSAVTSNAIRIHVFLFFTLSLPRFQNLDQVEAAQPPDDQQPRKEGRDHDDDRGPRVCSAADDERQPHQLRVDRPRDQPRKPPAQRAAEWNRQRRQ